MDDQVFLIHGADPAVQIQCQKDNGPLLVPNKYNDSCFGFNERSPALEATPGKGNIDCVIGFKGGRRAEGDRRRPLRLLTLVCCSLSPQAMSNRA